MSLIRSSRGRKHPLFYTTIIFFRGLFAIDVTGGVSFILEVIESIIEIYLLYLLYK